VLMPSRPTILRLPNPILHKKANYQSAPPTQAPRQTAKIPLLVKGRSGTIHASHPNWAIHAGCPPHASHATQSSTNTPKPQNSRSGQSSVRPPVIFSPPMDSLGKIGDK